MLSHLLNLLLVVSLLAGPLAQGGVQPAQQGEPEWVIFNTLDYPQLPAGLEVVEDYGSFVLGRMPAGGAKAGIPGLESLPERTLLTLNNVMFDTRQGAPEIPPALSAVPDDPYFLVQFIGPIKAEWVEALQALGVEILGYQPNYTYIVRMNPLLEEAARKLHAVQWVDHYQPAYRLPGQSQLDRADFADGRYALDVRFFEGVDPAAAQAAVLGTGANLEWLDGQQARVWALPEQIAGLAAISGVYIVEGHDDPTFQNEKAAQVTHTFDLWDSGRNRLGADLMGAGQVAGMVDSGLDDDDTTPLHLDFYDYTGGTSTTRIQAAIAGNGCGGACSCYTDDHLNSSGHGTHVAGSIVGNGYLSLRQRGLQAQAASSDPSFDYAFGVGQAPEARIAFARVAGRFGTTHGTLCGIGNSLTTWTNLYNQGARNANNSWGNSTTTYGGDAINADRAMWTYQDYLILTSASNAGPGWNTVAQPGTGKNLIAVGAAGNHRPQFDFSSSTASLLTEFSSRGPVNLSGGDGRTKPDIVAPGADVLSTRSTFIANSNLLLWGNEPGDGDANGVQDYVWSGGTSMSSPLVTGAATLVRDYLQDFQGLGDTTPPSAALVKAFLLNGAVDMGYGYESLGTSPYGGRNLQGWGMVNLEQSIAPRAPRSFFYDDFTNITDTVKQSTRGMNSSGDYVEYTVNVLDSSEPLKVTLTWTDPQNGSQGFAVNNLDLLVTAPNSIGYRGNVFSGSWSATGGSADAKNNTEAVYIQKPTLGAWTIRVTATAWASGTQPYALLASGGFGVSFSAARTCSGTTPDCSGRLGYSTRSYYPTLTQLSGTQEHTAPGSAFTTSLRLTNWGSSSDTFTFSQAYTNMSGAAASGLSVSYTPAGPYVLASGASQDIQVTVIVGTGVATGAYDVTVTAASAGNSAVKDAQVIALNVIPSTSLYNEKPVITESGAQFSPDLWAEGQNLWMAYTTAQSHNNSEAEVYAACSVDGGQTWSKTQIDNNSGLYFGKAEISGSVGGGSVTVVWTLADSTAAYARTWTRTSGCAGSWEAQKTLATTPSSSYSILTPDVAYDGDGTILAVWRYYPNGIYFSRSTDNGVNWSASVAVTDASGANHGMPSLARDAANNTIWLAYAHLVSGANRDIRIKRFNGAAGTDDWDAAGTNYVTVSNSGEREVFPGIAIINGFVWVSWNRYLDYTAPTARIYYARSTAALPTTPAFATIRGPYATRVAEYTIPQISGDATNVYIAYQTVSDTLRGGNLQALQVPASGAAPTATLQLTASVDDPPLRASGNAGAPRIAWAQTTLNGKTVTGPALLFAKNPPNSENPDYSSGLGVLQTLFNLEENVDLYLMQISPAVIPITYADTAGRCALNEPCYITFQGAVNDVDSSGSTYAYASQYDEALTLNKNITTSMLGDARLASLNMSAGTFNAFSGTLTLLGNFSHTGGSFLHGSGTLAFTGSGVQTITGNTDFHHVYVGSDTVLTSSALIGRSGSLTNLGWTDETRSISSTGTQSYGLAGVSVNLTAQGSLTSLQVRRRDQNHPSATSGIQTGKYWEINPTGSGYTADLTLEHSNLEDPKACRYSGGWDCARDTFTASGVTRLGLTAFSQWAVGNKVGPTAVRLTRLQAAAVPASPLGWLAAAAGLLLVGGGLLWRRKPRR